MSSPSTTETASRAPIYHLARDKSASVRTFRVCLDPGDGQEHIIAGIVRKCASCTDGSWEARFSAWTYYVPAPTKAEGVAYVLRMWLEMMAWRATDREIDEYLREVEEHVP